MSALLQEIAALAIVAVAAVYLFVKLTGWPRRKRPVHGVKLGYKLSKGIEKRRRGG